MLNTLYTYTGAREARLDSPLENERRKKKVAQGVFSSDSQSGFEPAWLRPRISARAAGTAHKRDVTIDWPRPPTRHPRTELC